MQRLFCDRCGIEHTAKAPVMEYWVKASVDLPTSVNHDFAYGIEAKTLELCQPCVEKFAGLCKAFIENAMEVDSIHLRVTQPMERSPEGEAS